MMPLSIADQTVRNRMSSQTPPYPLRVCERVRGRPGGKTAAQTCIRNPHRV